MFGGIRQDKSHCFLPLSIVSLGVSFLGSAEISDTFVRLPIVPVFSSVSPLILPYRVSFLGLS